ncbi:catechol O-methyltransferase A isoform X1 [Micropterus dolomieu]|uniref:catechol O-methyltransferase A isoform X1 n=2 Tax=Micropterus dolomieu TaxID=147949 RepID=UPI001E8DDFF3|nr:catechol O-methyltransferase A isoform X1 [Micropterus dolomieu]
MMKVLWVGSSIRQTCCQNSMSLLTALVVLVALYVLCRCLIPRLVQCNSTLALLWHDVLLEMMLDLLGGTTRPQRLLRAVCVNAVRGDPDSVITAIDCFCKHTEWAMNVGDEKGAILDSVVMETSPSTVLELGTYCGYSAVRIARLLSPETKLISVEMNPEYADVARQVIQHAGLQDKVCVLEGESADLIPKMADMFGIQTFDFVFLDHWKDHYLPDIRLLEDCGLLARGSVVLADNVVCPGAPEYLNYIRSSLKYSSRFYQAHLEYTRVLDGLERSEYQGERKQTDR